MIPIEIMTINSTENAAKTLKRYFSSTGFGCIFSNAIMSSQHQSRTQRLKIVNKNTDYM